jgi:hypothetical protein
MRILVLLWLVLPLGLKAQLVSGDGVVLHFVSTLVARGSELPPAARLLRYGADGFQVEATLQLDPTVDVFGKPTRRSIPLHRLRGGKRDRAYSETLS